MNLKKKKSFKKLELGQDQENKIILTFTMISLFYNCLPKISMIWSTVSEI